ncbi:hypothetical protein HDU96_003939 [Neofusicoccum parvum]|nr:hypothetical protein HDU96_003939 [Neofusicoccum parvum]
MDMFRREHRTLAAQKCCCVVELILKSKVKCSLALLICGFQVGTVFEKKVYGLVPFLSMVASQLESGTFFRYRVFQDQDIADEGNGIVQDMYVSKDS